MEGKDEFSHKISAQNSLYIMRYYDLNLEKSRSFD